MQAITSSVFRIIRFPHEGQIITLDQLDFCATSVPHGSVHTIPSVENSHNSVESIVVGMFKDSSLLETFLILPPICYISSTPLDSVPFDHASTSTGLGVAPHSLLGAPSPVLGVSDPWVFPIPLSIDSMAESMPLTAVELKYQAIQMAFEDANLLHPSEGASNPYTSLSQAIAPSLSGDILDFVLPSDEAILEIMVGFNRHWEEMHHHLPFLPHSLNVESVFSGSLEDGSHVPHLFYDIFIKGNMFLKLAFELPLNTYAHEERLLYLDCLDEDRQALAMVNESHKLHFKAQYNPPMRPHMFAESNMVLVYDQDHDRLGSGKFEPICLGPYVVKQVLTNEAYELVYHEGCPLREPRNGLFLKWLLA